MTPMTLAEQLVMQLPADRPRLFNPWRSRCSYDSRWNGPEARLERLAKHLDCQPRFVLIGEAPGYCGCRYSGIAFTSEQLLLDGCIPRVDSESARLTTFPAPKREGSATCVWRSLYDLGIEDSTVLWNAVQLHPHTEGNVLTNRTPTTEELALGESPLRLLRAHYSQALFIAVGDKAERLLQKIGIDPLRKVRHPSYGGAGYFHQQLAEIVHATEVNS